MIFKTFEDPSRMKTEQLYGPAKSVGPSRNGPLTRNKITGFKKASKKISYTLIVLQHFRWPLIHICSDTFADRS